MNPPICKPVTSLMYLNDDVGPGLASPKTCTYTEDDQLKIRIAASHQIHHYDETDTLDCGVTVHERSLQSGKLS